MNIFKTFETFLREPLSVLKHNWVQLVSLQTENLFANKPSCEVTLLKDGAQFTVINNEKLYNLLSLVMYKAKNKETKQEQTISQK